MNLRNPSISVIRGSDHPKIRDRVGWPVAFGLLDGLSAKLGAFQRFWTAICGAWELTYWALGSHLPENDARKMSLGKLLVGWSAVAVSSWRVVAVRWPRALALSSQLAAVFSACPSWLPAPTSLYGSPRTHARPSHIAANARSLSDGAATPLAD